MSDDQKIWFIYLTDHHEGPFTAEEIAEKAKAGLVNGQSLAWKDGMPEWVAAETIPELAPGMGGGGGGAPTADDSGLALGGNTSLTSAPVDAAAPEPSNTGDGEVSLAQLLAQSQKSGENSSVTATGAIVDSASVLSSMVNNVHANTTLTKGAISLGGGIAAPGPPEPEIDDEVWTLKIGSQVSGLHSLRRLKDLAGSGEVPTDAMLWHPGWSDFQPISSVPQVASARKSGGGMTRGISAPAGGTRTGITRPGMTMSAQSNSALDRDNDDEPTDTGIEAPPPPGFKGILFRIHTFVEKLKRRSAKGKQDAAALKGKAGFAPVGSPKKTASKGKEGGSAKRLAMALGILLVLGGGGAAAYFLLLTSPIPSNIDVSDFNREQMVNVVTLKEGHKLFLARARGTDENPADPNSPTFYVASNFPEGTQVTLAIAGVTGTMVNKTSFEKSITATVDKIHLATFDKISDEGKPLWGEFSIKVSAEGADPVEGKPFFIGSKSAAYRTRLKTYKDSIQADYDKEIGELREYIPTLKGLQVEASKQIADYKAGWATPSLRAKITTDWANFTKTSTVLLAQLEAPAKARQPGGSNEAKFHGRAFQDVGTTVGQLQQLVKVHGERLAGSAAPSGNADEIDGLVQAGVQALESWLALAVAKTPFDAAKPSDGGAKAPVAAPAPTPAPAAGMAAAAAPAPAAIPAPAVAPAPTSVAAPALVAAPAPAVIAPATAPAAAH
jgi:hypothetical protein